MAISHPFLRIKIFLNISTKLKRQLIAKTVFLGEGIFTMGLVKNYI